MYHYNYGGLVNEKQKEIEKTSYEAWKLTDFNQESLVKQIIQKLSFTKQHPKKTVQQNKCDCICEC